MEIYITWQSVVTAAAVIAAIVAIISYFAKGHKWFLHQNEQDEEINRLKIEMQELKGEQQIIVYGVLACLKGLKEQGANGPVTEAINKIEKYLNAKAHNQN